MTLSSLMILMMYAPLGTSTCNVYPVATAGIILLVMIFPVMSENKSSEVLNLERSYVKLTIPLVGFGESVKAMDGSRLVVDVVSSAE